MPETVVKLNETPKSTLSLVEEDLFTSMPKVWSKKGIFVKDKQKQVIHLIEKSKGTFEHDFGPVEKVRMDHCINHNHCGLLKVTKKTLKRHFQRIKTLLLSRVLFLVFKQYFSRLIFDPLLFYIFSNTKINMKCDIIRL